MKDRGAIKWSAMMLPEHKKLLAKIYDEPEYVEKPILDENKCGEINLILLLAIRESRLVRIKYYQEHTFCKIEGIIKKYISTEKRLKIIDNLDKIMFLDIDQIVDVEMI